MNKFTVIGCIAILIFMAAPVLAQEHIEYEDDGMGIEEGVFVDDIQPSTWRSLGLIRRIERIGGKVRATGTNGWVETNHPQRISIVLAAFGSNLQLRVPWVSQYWWNKLEISR